MSILAIITAVHAGVIISCLQPWWLHPVLRTIIVATYILTCPGYLLLTLIAGSRWGSLERMVAGTGVSLVHAMTLSLVVSLATVGVVERPLDRIYLPASAAITGSLAAFLAVRGRLTEVPWQGLSVSLLSAWGVLPALASIGAILGRGDNGGVWVVLALVTLTVASGALVFTRLDDRHALIALFAMGLSLAVLKYLHAMYLPVGGDIRAEAYTAELVLRKGAWQPGGMNLYWPMLSVSGLPVVVAGGTGTDIDTAFKAVLAQTVAFIAPALYLFLRQAFSPRSALLGALLLLGHFTFMPSLTEIGRQAIASLEVIVFLWLLFQTTSFFRRETLILGVLLFGVVVTHYTVAALLVGSLVCSLAVCLVISRDKTAVALFGGLFGVAIGLMWLWFTWASEGALLHAFIRRGELVIQAIKEGLIFNKEVVSAAQGTIPHGISPRLLLAGQWVLIVLALLGSVLTLRRRDPEGTNEVRLLTICAGGIMLGLGFVVLPGSAESVASFRALQLLLPWLLPLSILGLQGLNVMFRGRPWRKAFFVLAATGIAFYSALGFGLVSRLLGETDFTGLFEPQRRETLAEKEVAELVATRGGQQPLCTDRIGWEYLSRMVRRGKLWVVSSTDYAPRQPGYVSPADIQGGFGRTTTLVSVDGVLSGVCLLFLRSENVAGAWVLRPYALGEWSARLKRQEETVASQLGRYRFSMNLLIDGGGAQVYSTGVKAETKAGE